MSFVKLTKLGMYQHDKECEMEFLNVYKNTCKYIRKLKNKLSQSQFLQQLTISDLTMSMNEYTEVKKLPWTAFQLPLRA